MRGARQKTSIHKRLLKRFNCMINRFNQHSAASRCHSKPPPLSVIPSTSRYSEEPSPCHSEEVARPTKNLIQGHSSLRSESVLPKTFASNWQFSFSCTFLCKKVPKSFCTVKMAASVFTRSLSGHGRLTLFRTPAPGARSLDERNPAISTSAGFRKNHSRARPGRSRCKREPGSAQNCSVILNEVKNLISTDVSLRST